MRAVRCEPPPGLASLEAAEGTPWTTYALIGAGVLALGLIVILALRK